MKSDPVQFTRLRAVIESTIKNESLSDCVTFGLMKTGGKRADTPTLPALPGDENA